MAFETFVVAVVRHLRRPVGAAVDPEKLLRHSQLLVVAVDAVVVVAAVVGVVVAGVDGEEQQRVAEQPRLD